MIEKEDYFTSSNMRTQIHYVTWQPEGDIVAIVQIVHGMNDFIGRYDRFASYLADKGIMVVGHDMLGHGQSVRNQDELGYFFEEHEVYLVKDVEKLRNIISKQYPDKPYYILGHSMGSFLTTLYIQQYGLHLQGAIIMGTGYQAGYKLAFGKLVCKLLAKRKGWMYRSPFVNKMALESNNKPFTPARTKFDWLTRDNQVVDEYCANPLNTFVFTLNGFYTLFSLISKVQKLKHTQEIPSNLSVFFVSGSKDPVGGFEKGVRKVYKRFKKAHIRDIQMKFYPEDRHEILNELDYQTVQEDLYHWILSKLNS